MTKLANCSRISPYCRRIGRREARDAPPNCEYRWRNIGGWPVERHRIANCAAGIADVSAALRELRIAAKTKALLTAKTPRTQREIKILEFIYDAMTLLPGSIIKPPIQ